MERRDRGEKRRRLVGQKETMQEIKPAEWGKLCAGGRRGGARGGANIDSSESQIALRKPERREKKNGLLERKRRYAGEGSSAGKA